MAKSDSHEGSDPNDSAGQVVRHPLHGQGEVLLNRGSTAVVRFAHGLEECAVGTLTAVEGLRSRFLRSTWDAPLSTLVRLQAEAIVSVNDLWGVFSRSRIDLLPHQLWVCRKVLERWPARWLVADDVGLGKTVEAGLILWPLISSGRVRRLLVVCPAGLCEQWQTRLREMFDLRMALHDPAVDTSKSDFWNTNHQVVASLQTLRLDQPETARARRSRLLDSDPWDLVVVDEAHHLNYDEQGGPTLGYKLFEELGDRGKVASLLFFTGTPHRGKHFGFFALLRLLRPDLFDPHKPMQDQLEHLRHVLIRNNKSTVTDLRGRRLFQSPIVSAESYRYTPEERRFYDLLSVFITTGRAYASSLAAGDARTVQLVLIAMQKLASSSVAAIRSAIEGRLSRLSEHRRDADRAREQREALAAYLEAEQEDRLDELSALDERIAMLEARVALVQDEEEHLRELLRAATDVRTETKVAKLMEVVSERFRDESVLFFTEYKATQALVMSALIERFGEASVTFINGDDRIEGVRLGNGRVGMVSLPRDDARSAFNSGRARFLVSTEASGEGVDLQERCSALIHVDLPWNPMRLHQRVGRLNRYGQTKQVRVVSLRNPDTVEARIWAKLDEKINNIMVAQSRFMDEPEDLLELVLGMTSPSLFRELFSESAAVPRERLAEWFDSKTARFGGRDVVETVQQLVGNAARFDFQQVSTHVPQLDLADLRPFFVAQLGLNRRRATTTEERLSFKTPDEWLSDPGVRTHYDGLVFDRHGVPPRESHRVVGVGHRAFDQALRQARAYNDALASIPKELLRRPLVILRIHDRVTDTGRHVRWSVAGVECDVEGRATQLLRDWELLRVLNTISEGVRGSSVPSQRPQESEAVLAAAESARRLALERLDELQLPYDVPEVVVHGLLWPANELCRDVESPT